MFPESNWADDLNWYNAAVTEAEVRTSSGFIYFIDQVVGPVMSIEHYLNNNQDKFGIFYYIIQRFAQYGDPKKRIEDNTVMYKKSYSQIEDIANELGPRPTNPWCFKHIFSVYIPTDEAMQEYLNNTIYKHYNSLDSVPDITLYYLAQSHISGSLGLLSKIESSFFNTFGDQIELTRNDFASAYMASNGPVYGMNKVLEPNVFRAVPGRLFIDKNYTTFLFCLNSVNLVSVLSDIDSEVTFFAASNSEMEAANIRYHPVNERIQTRGLDGVWRYMNEDELIELMQDHIYHGRVDNLKGEGFLEMMSKNHVYYNNGKVQAGKNQALNSPAVVSSSSSEINGSLHILDKPIRTRYTYGELLMNDPDCSEFAKLMVDAGMFNLNYTDPVTLDTIPNLIFIAEADYWTAFIPDNDAVKQAIAQGLIPTETNVLRDFIAYHFIRKSTIFDDGKLNGQFESNSIKEVTPQGAIVYHKHDIRNNVHNLVLTDGSGQTVSVDHLKANHLVRRGVVHKINTVLKK